MEASAPPPPVPPPGAPQNRNPQSIPNYLWQSIVVTIVCCLPLGIPAIVYATRVNNLLLQGDTVGAAQASQSARMWCWISVAGGVLAGVVYGILMLVGVLADH